VASISWRRALAEARRRQREVVLRLQDRAMVWMILLDVVGGCGCGGEGATSRHSLKVGKNDVSLFWQVLEY
jgi:hypothetical protein